MHYFLLFNIINNLFDVILNIFDHVCLNKIKYNDYYNYAWKMLILSLLLTFNKGIINIDNKIIKNKKFKDLSVKSLSMWT